MDSERDSETASDGSGAGRETRTIIDCLAGDHRLGRVCDDGCAALEAQKWLHYPLAPEMRWEIGGRAKLVSWPRLDAAGRQSAR